MTRITQWEMLPWRFNCQRWTRVTPTATTTLSMWSAKPMGAPSPVSSVLIKPTCRSQLRQITRHLQPITPFLCRFTILTNQVCWMTSSSSPSKSSSMMHWTQPTKRTRYPILQHWCRLHSKMTWKIRLLYRIMYNSMNYQASFQIPEMQLQ